MSLGKLLTTGKSLVGLSNENSRYHLQKGALPKFESAKNPCGLKANAEAPEREPQLSKLTPAEVTPAEVAAAEVTPAELAAADLKKTERLPVLAALIAVREASVALSRESQRAQAPQVPAPMDGWLKKLNPMVWFGNSKPTESKAALPRFSKSSTPVQGELSLDNIKVMRNDLSEADVEVVPAKSRPVKVVAAPMQASAAAMAIPDLPPATTAWEYLGERLLGKD